jgi:hypothetical protein
MCKDVYRGAEMETKQDVVARLLDTIDDLVGYDVLIHAAVEHELENAYKAGVAATKAAMIKAVDNDEELYDLLPGDGRDDFILSQLRKNINALEVK